MPPAGSRGSTAVVLEEDFVVFELPVSLEELPPELAAALWLLPEVDAAEPPFVVESFDELLAVVEADPDVDPKLDPEIDSDVAPDDVAVVSTDSVVLVVDGDEEEVSESDCLDQLAFTITPHESPTALRIVLPSK